MSDKVYIYGESNGASYAKGNDGSGRHTHWDPRIEVRAFAGTVQVGIVPPSKAGSTDEQGLWNSDDGQFLTLSRDGINRTIRALREARVAMYGVDE
jgi:hypothetical protein